jgi:hypothetical protein
MCQAVVYLAQDNREQEVMRDVALPRWHPGAQDLGWSSGCCGAARWAMRGGEWL